MATETESFAFVTAPSTPEASVVAAAAAPTVEPAAQPAAPAAPAAPTVEPAAQPVAPAAPAAPTVEPAAQPVVRVAPAPPIAPNVQPAAQPGAPAPPMTPTVEPAAPAAPMTPTVEPAAPAAPMTPTVEPAAQPGAPAAPMTPTMEPAAQPAPADRLEIVIEQGLSQHGDGESSTMTIFRVPAHVRDASKELYEPRLVSVGPYYRGREALRAMQQHKWRYMRELMRRSPQPAASLADYIIAVRDVEQKARRCYSERTSIFDAAAAQSEPSAGGEIEEAQSRRHGDGNPGPDGFAEMLMLDGCFILEFFAKWWNGESDKLCDVAWGLPLLHSDLLLLENQIPFFVLEKLFYVVSPTVTWFDLLTMILERLKFSFTFCELSTAEELVQVEPEIQFHHLLHLLYEAIMPSADESETAPAPTMVQQLHEMCDRLKKAVSTRFVFIRDMPRVPDWMKTTLPATRLRNVGACFSKLLPLIRRTPAAPAPTTLVVPSVTQLREAGVRFKEKPSPLHMFDIKFNRDTGLLEMPRMVVDYANKALLVNLVAFEQTTDLPGNARRLSSYAALVGALVRTGSDVEHLQKHGIVENLLDGDDDAATKFFQHLGDCSSLNYDDHMFAGMFKELRGFYHSSWQKHKAKFLRDHCSSPWAVLALVVAICAFCFALFKLSTTIFGLAHPGYCHC